MSRLQFVRWVRLPYTALRLVWLAWVQSTLVDHLAAIERAPTVGPRHRRETIHQLEVCICEKIWETRELPWQTRAR